MFKKCEKCGNTFRCFMSEQCWCNDLKVKNAARLEKYIDCLCETCLKSI